MLKQFPKAIKHFYISKIKGCNTNDSLLINQSVIPYDVGMTSETPCLYVENISDEMIRCRSKPEKKVTDPFAVYHFLKGVFKSFKLEYIGSLT